MRDDTLLRMRATDAGFERQLAPTGNWICFSLPSGLATIWLKSEEFENIVAVSPAAVAAELTSSASPEKWNGELPPGATAAWACSGFGALDALCRRIAILGKVLPNQPLVRYEQQVLEELGRSSADRETERIAEVRQRIGQANFREALIGYWDGRCPISGVTEPALLRASHAKPWSEATDVERLDVHNGLLLAAHLDAAFDRGLIGVGPQGEVLVSPSLPTIERRVLGLDGEARAIPVAPAHAPYFAWHRQHLFNTTN